MRSLNFKNFNAIKGNLNFLNIISNHVYFVNKFVRQILTKNAFGQNWVFFRPKCPQILNEKIVNNITFSIQKLFKKNEKMIEIRFD